MRLFRPLNLTRTLLIGSLVMLQTGIGAAQIPGVPINTGGTQDALDQTVNNTVTTVNNTIPDTNTVTNTTDTVNQTVDQTTNTVTETTNTVNQTVTETTNTVTETVNQTVDQTTNTVNQTTNTVTNTVNQTVNETTNTVTETTNTVQEAAPKPKAPKPAASPIDTVGTVVETVTGTTTTVTTGTQDAISALGGATGQYGAPSGSDVIIAPSAGPADAISAIAAAGGSGTGGLLGLSGGTTATGLAGGGGVYYRSAAGGVLSSGAAKRFQGARFLLNWTSILGVSQPSLAILVDAVNDADGDGIFSDSEIAAVPGAEVSFKALVTNIGAVNFEIATVTHGYNGGMGAAQGAVCGELTGIMLAPGESLACSFPVPGYAPEQGGTLISTITAAGFEVGKKARRGASDSDTSQVDTLLAGDEVLAVAIKRNLAFTGTDAARLLALGLLLLGAGGAFLALARTRGRKPEMPLPSDSPVDVIGWWGAGPARSGSKWKVGKR